MDNFISIGLLLSRASIALSKAMNHAILQYGIDLPHSQFIVLRCLYYNNGISQLDIANLLPKDAAAIKRTVDQLEKKGFVERKHIRNLKNSVCITSKGKEFMPKLLKIGDDIINIALDDIKQNDQTNLKIMLEKIFVNINNRKDE